jgi:RNA polymerase subunit RPABC4/transcription elongation factor Spt4
MTGRWRRVCAHEWEHTGCVFGCGAVVEPDTGICRSCHDHSANVEVCTRCDAEREDWQGQIITREGMR